jgi:hypothetical protein
VSYTPLQIEAALSSIVTRIAQAQLALAKARADEAEAEKALKRAEVTAHFHPDCPKPQRSTGLTVADREAWISRAVMRQWEAHLDAVKAREIAVDARTAVAAELEAIRSIGTLTRQAYQMAGIGER